MTGCNVTMYWTNVLSKIWMIILVYLTLPSRTLGAGHLERDLKLLSNLFPGHYSNKEQYLRDIENKVPSDKRHLSMQILTRPVHLQFLPNSFSLYVEKYINYERTPFKQWLYNFHTDYEGMVINMKVYNFRTEELKTQLYNNFKALQNIDLKNLTSSTECNMLWRRLGANKFIGTTRRQCTGNVNDQKVWISMSGTLTPTSLQWHEGWYRFKDGKNMLTEVSPYVMKKIRKIKGPSYNPAENQEKVAEASKAALQSSKTERMREEVPSILVTPSPPSKPSPRSLGTSNIMSDRLVSPRKRKSWKLHDFHGVMGALLEGRRVHFAADTKKCTLAGHKDVGRTVFGDFIDVFEIHRSNGDNGRNFIKFSNSHKVNVDSEFVEMLRDITLYADGTTVVDLYTLDPNKKQILKQSMAVCRLYSGSTGDVRFTVDPRYKVRLVKNFRSLRHNLQKGKRLRLLTDLSRCSGSDERRIVLGGELKGYDILNGNYEIEVTMERMITDSNLESIVSFRHFDGKFMSSNMATITLTDRGVSRNIFNQYGGKETRHRCALSKNRNNLSLLVFHM